MSFTLTRGDATKVTFHLKYTGEGNPVDAHIYLLDPARPGIDHAREIITVPQIPQGATAKGGFDIPYYPNPPVFPQKDGHLAPGVYTFGLAWSFGGQHPNEPDPDHPSLTQNTPIEPPKKWDWEVFMGKLAASMLGSAASGAVLNWWNVVAILPCVLTGALGGFISSVLGQLFVHFFDAPRKWTFRSSFLFTLFFTIAFFMLYGTLALSLEREAIARGELMDRVTFGCGLVAGFLATTLSGVLDNLRNDA